jgi:hypothetical protein
VNLFDERESDIRPRETIQIGQATVASTASQQVGQRELWPWLAGLALLILLIEWQAYHRKPLPALQGLHSRTAAEDGGLSRHRK